MKLCKIRENLKELIKDQQIYEKDQQIRKPQEEIEATHERHFSAIHTKMETTHRKKHSRN
jgi:hypothetical protein